MDTYLGSIEYDESNTWGKYLYVEVEIEQLNDVLKTFVSHPQYITHYNSEIHETIFFVFEFTKNQLKIVEAFLAGQYSLIDRDYVAKYFKPDSLNYRILTKDANRAYENSLHKYWYDRIGIHLPDNAEVWSRPEKKDEIFGFLEFA